MIPTVEMIDAGWKATLGLNKIQVERILVAALAAMPPEDDVTALKRMAMSVGMEFTPHKQAPVQADAEHEAMPGLALKRYTPCGGCGADKPSDRCIGCLHDFGGGSWETSKMFSNQPAPDIAAENKRLREALEKIAAISDGHPANIADLQEQRYSANAVRIARAALERR